MSEKVVKSFLTDQGVEEVEDEVLAYLVAMVDDQVEQLECASPGGGGDGAGAGAGGATAEEEAESAAQLLEMVVGFFEQLEGKATAEACGGMLAKIRRRRHVMSKGATFVVSDPTPPPPPILDPSATAIEAEEAARRVIPKHLRKLVAALKNTTGYPWTHGPTRPIHRPSELNVLTNPPTYRPTNRPTHQPTNPGTKQQQLNHQPTNPPANPPTHQSGSRRMRVTVLRWRSTRPRTTMPLSSPLRRRPRGCSSI